MALNEKRTSKNQQDHTIGPTMPSGGGDPVNPAETLRTGALPRRSFDVKQNGWKLDRPVVLFRGESTRQNADWNDPDDSSPEDYCQPKPEGVDPAGAKFGKQPSPAPEGSNKEFGEHGARIYGT